MVSITPASCPGFKLTRGNARDSKKSISQSSRRGSGAHSKNEIFPVQAGRMDGKTWGWHWHRVGLMCEQPGSGCRS